MTLATKIAAPKHVEVQQLGTPADIHHRSANTFVADSMGSPAMNRLTGTLHLAQKELQLVFGEFPLPPYRPIEVLLACADHYESIDMGIRAENIAHVSGKQSSGESSGTLNLTKCLVSLTGSDTFIATRDGDFHFTARVENYLRARTGDQISLGFDMSKAHYSDSTSAERVA